MKTKSETPPKRQIILCVRVLMAKHGIRSVASLHRILIESGVEISHPQLIRVIDNRAGHISVPLLNGFLNVFNCQVSELFVEAIA